MNALDFIFHLKLEKLDNYNKSTRIDVLFNERASSTNNAIFEYWMEGYLTYLI